MRWVYRLQQRIAITRGECNVILALALLFCLGLTARYIQSQVQPLPADDYAEAEFLFQQASEAPLAEPVEQALPVLTAEPSPKPTTYPSKSAPPAGSINLNTATASELQRLHLSLNVAGRTAQAKQQREREDHVALASGDGDTLLKSIYPSHGVSWS